MSLSDRTIYIFTPEVFTVVGSPTITNDGIASGFSNTSYINQKISFSNKYTIKGSFKTSETLNSYQEVFSLFNPSVNTDLLLALRIMATTEVAVLVRKADNLTQQLRFNIGPNKEYYYEISVQNNKVNVLFNNMQTAHSDLLVDRIPTEIHMGAGWAGYGPFTGSIDLKAFSISVDGKEVFSGSRKIKLGTPVLDDSEHLPKVVTNVLGIDDILLAIDPEVQLLRVDISDLIKELYVKTTDKFIRRWENDFSLPYDSSLTLQQRRQRVLNKLARKKTLTWKNLKLLIRNNIDNPQFYIMNDSENYHFTIMVQTPNYNELTKALDETIPAYLTYDIIVTEYFKRCGTFASGTNPL